MIDFKIEGLTLAVTDMEKMLQFYSHVFGIKFARQELGSAVLYAGKWGNMQILFCPAQIAGNTAKQNRHQFDIVTEDLENMFAKVKESGGEMMGSVTTASDGSKSIGIYDPDKNSMVIKQPKTNN